MLDFKVNLGYVKSFLKNQVLSNKTTFMAAERQILLFGLLNLVKAVLNVTKCWRNVYIIQR